MNFCGYVMVAPRLKASGTEPRRAAVYSCVRDIEEGQKRRGKYRERRKREEESEREKEESRGGREGRGRKKKKGGREKGNGREKEERRGRGERRDDLDQERAALTLRSMRAARSPCADAGSNLEPVIFSYSSM